MLPGHAVTCGAAAAAVLFVASAIAAPVNYHSPAGEPFVHASQYITSFDDTRLAVYVYRPASDGRPDDGQFPVIMMQTPRQIGASPEQLQSAHRLHVVRRFTEHGYVVVIQDRRGVGASFGHSTGFLTKDDARDAKAAIEWAGAQPWSTGKVGAFGCSNEGGWQYVTAVEKPRHLVAIAPDCASAMFFDQMISPNGVSAFVLGDRPPFDGTCAPSADVALPVDSDPTGELAEAAAEEHRCNSPFLGQYRAHMHRDSVDDHLGYAPGMVDSAAMHPADFRASGIRMLQLAGWFDGGPGSALMGQQAFDGRIIIGPWAHCQLAAMSLAGPGAATPARGWHDGELDSLAIHLRWFDETLKGEATGLAGESPITFYTMHAPQGTEWRSVESWPHPAQQPTPYYLSGNATADPVVTNGGALDSQAPRSGAPADSYEPDFTSVIFEGYSMLSRQPRDGVTLPVRSGLTYTTASLEQPLQVTGFPQVRLWVRSSAADLDFFVILEDVHPDGSAEFVTEGMIRASRRALGTPPWGDLGLPWLTQLAADDQPLSQESPAELRFAMNPTSWQFRKGHRVRFTIQNSGGPMFQLPPSLDPTEKHRVDVLRDDEHPSSVTLPVIPSPPASVETPGVIESARWKTQSPPEDAQ